MKTFFSDEEKARLREQYISTSVSTLDVFKIAQEERSRLLGLNSKHCDYGIDILDIALGNFRIPETSEGNNRKKLIMMIEKWLAIPQVDFSLAATYLRGELGIGKNSTQTIEQRLNTAYEKIGMAEELMKLANRFPYLFMEDQFNHILTADKQELNSIRPQFAFLDNLTLEGIANGDIDYTQLKEINKFYSAFSPTLLTLQDIEEMELPKGHAFFPILNSNFYNRKRFDFKGVVEVIPENVFEAVSSLDPRIYQFGREGIDIRNFLTAAIMSGDKAQAGVLKICDSIKEGDYTDIRFGIDRNVILNIGLMIGDEELLTTDTRKLAENLMNPKKAIQAALRKRVEESYLPVSESGLEQAAYELSRTGFQVGYRYMRKEQNYLDINNLPKAMNPGLLLIDIQRKASMFMPLLQAYMDQIFTDIQYTLKQGPRKMPNGGKFYHENKGFFEAFKSDPEKIDIFRAIDIVEKIAAKMEDKDFKEFIETTKEGIASGNHELREGITNPGVMHYLSLRYPGDIVIEEINSILGVDLLLGYAMHNCLSVMDLMRYHSNPDARIYCFWLDGLKGGISYDLMLQRAGSKKPVKDPLIDSIELGDQFCKSMEKLYRSSDGEKVPDSWFTSTLVNLYLSTRLNNSENGIYILPESNNFHVKQAMGDFIKSYNGEPVLGYEGNRVNTDTDFRRMPYWIERSKVMKGTKNIVFDTTGKILDPNASTDINYPWLTGDANRLLNTQMNRQIQR